MDETIVKKLAAGYAAGDSIKEQSIKRAEARNGLRLKEIFFDSNNI